MYETIVVTLSLTHGYGATAIGVARNLLSENGKIIAVHVVEPIHTSVSLFVPQDHMEKIRRDAKQDIAQRVGDMGSVETVLLMDTNPGRAITRYAEQIKADCIVVGSHKSDSGEYFLGSTTSRIVRHAPCAVHVLR